MQQHLEDAKKKGLLRREGAGIGEKWRMLHTTELLVSKESKDEHANGERASKRCLVLRRPPQHDQLGRGGRSVSSGCCCRR